MGICRTAWESRACVICPSNGRGSTKPSLLPPINRPVDSQFYPPLKARAGKRHSASHRKNSPNGFRQHLILGLWVSAIRFLCFQEREFSGQRKAEVASPIECRFRRYG